MDYEDLHKIGEWLNTLGYDIDLNDQLWMEDYIQDHKFKDVIELIFDYNKFKEEN